jgi:hypothetical protein
VSFQKSAFPRQRNRLGVHPAPRSSAGLPHPEASEPPNPRGRPGPEQDAGAQWRVGEEANRARGGARWPCGPFGYSGSREETACYLRRCDQGGAAGPSPSRLRAEGAAACETKKIKKTMNIKKKRNVIKRCLVGMSSRCAAHHAHSARHDSGTSDAGAAQQWRACGASDWVIKTVICRLQAPICVHSSPFQRDTAVTGP